MELVGRAALVQFMKQNIVKLVITSRRHSQSDRLEMNGGEHVVAGNMICHGASLANVVSKSLVRSLSKGRNVYV